MIALSPLSIVESLSQGFAVVNRRPWLIAIPLALNLLLWLGPAVTAAPVTEGWAEAYARLMEENPGVAAAQGRPVAEMLSEAQQLAAAAGQFNLLRVLAFQIPALMTDGGPSEESWAVGSTGALLALVAGLLLAGLYAVSAYLTLIAGQVRSAGLSVALLPERVRRNWLRLLGYYAVIIAVALPVLLGVSMLLMLARLFGEGPAALVASVSVGVALLVQVYLFFAYPAIFLFNAGPVQAMRQSALVVSRFFWSCLGFILVNWVIGTGFTLIFTRLFAFEPLGSAAAVLGHAYISTGLAAAAMAFFQNRIALLAAARSRAGAPSP